MKERRSVVDYILLQRGAIMDRMMAGGSGAMIG